MINTIRKVRTMDYLRRHNALDLLHDGATDDPNNLDWRRVRLAAAA